MANRIALASAAALSLLLAGGAAATPDEFAACTAPDATPKAAAAACSRVLAPKAGPDRLKAAAHLCRARALSTLDEGDGGAADYGEALKLSGGLGGIVPEAACVPGGDVALAICGLEDFKGYDFVLEACGLASGRAEAGTAQSRAAALRVRAISSLKGGRREEAVADLDRLLALEPEDSEALSMRGRALFDGGRLRSAAADFRGAVRLRPEDAGSRQRLIHALLITGDLSGALAESDELVRLRPEDAVSFLERSRIRGVRGEAAEALADLRQAGRLDPHWAEPRPQHTAVLERAIFQLGRLIEMRFGPEAAGLHRLRGQANARRGELADALADFDEAVRLKRDDVVALAGRADIRMRRLDFPGGVADFRAALAVGEAAAAEQGPDAMAARNTAREIVAEFGETVSAAIGMSKAMR